MSGPGTILVVDDDANNSRTLQALLASLGHRVEIVSDGLQALEQAPALAPDLILLDVMMPAMDGFEVCRRLRADPRVAEVPVILVTSLDDRQSRLHGLEAGADDFVTKPFDRLELRARVQSVMRLNRYRRLLAERQRFAWAVDESEDGYLLVAEGGRVEYANARARRYLGLPETDDPPAGDRFMELARRRYRCEPAGAGDDPAALVYLVRPETDMERATWLNVNALALPAALGVGHLLRLRDVTAQMGARYEMWSFGVFARHKLRAPLAAVHGSLELLADTPGEALSEEARQLLKLAQRGVARLQSEVQAVLRYMDSPGMARQGAPFELAGLEPLVRQLGVELGLGPIEVHVAASVASAQVWPSAPAMTLMLHELLDNARKFHPRGAPQVSVEVEPAPGDAIILRLTDDGRSLPPDELTRMWHPYYQVEKSMTGEVKGMGLGLSMIAALLATIGGASRAYNRPDGPGLMVELQLPPATAA